MSINTTLAGLSQNVANNGPDGAVDPPSMLDDAIRYHGAFIAKIRDDYPVANALISSDLANTTDPAKGAALVGNTGETVAQSFEALQLADYAALRASTSPRKSIYVTGYLVTAAPSGISGMFIRDDTDTTTPDNAGTVIVRADGKRYKRPDSGVLNVQWFGAMGNWNGTTGADDTAAIQAALNSLPANFPRIYTILLPATAGSYKVSATLTNSRGGIHIKGESGAKIQWTGADFGLVFDFGLIGTLTYRYTLSGFSIYGTNTVSKPHCFKFTQVSELNTNALSFFDCRDIYTFNRVNIGFITDQYCYRPDNFIVGAQTATATDFGISNGQIFLDKLNVYSCSGHFCDIRSGIFTSLTITNSWIEQFTHLINVAYSGTDVTSFGLARLRMENLDVTSFSRLIYAYGSANAVINPFFVSLDINRVYAANKTGTLPWIEINKNGNTHVSSAYGKEINLTGIEIQTSDLSSGVLNITGGTPNVRIKSLQMQTPGPLLVGVAIPLDMPKVLFTPVWASTGTQPVLGNAVLASSYTVDAGIVRLSLLLSMGSTTTFGTGNYTFSLPFAASVDTSSLGLGTALLVTGGGATFNYGSALIDNNSTTMTLFFGNAAWSSGAPVALASGSVMRVNVSYRVSA